MEKNDEKTADTGEEVTIPRAEDMVKRVAEETRARGEEYRRSHPEFTRNLAKFLADVHQGTEVLVNSRNRHEFPFEDTCKCLEGLGYQVSAAANGAVVVAGGNPYIPFWIRWIPIKNV